LNHEHVLVAGELQPWQDRALPMAERVADLLGRMTLPEKIAQLYGVWVGVPEGDDDVAPFQHELIDDVDWPELIKLGLGQLTRPFGTAPVDAAAGAMALARIQAEIMTAARFRIPAIAHEECLSGFMTWGATVYPSAGLGCRVQPGAGAADGRPDRRRHARRRCPPGLGAGARRDPGSTLGSHRGNHR